jgi:hypothetical protein
LGILWILEIPGHLDYRITGINYNDYYPLIIKCVVGMGYLVAIPESL